MIGILRAFLNGCLGNVGHRSGLAVAYQLDAISGLGIVVLSYRHTVCWRYSKDLIHNGVFILYAFSAIALVINIIISIFILEGYANGILVIHVLTGLHVVAVHCLHQLRQIGGAAGGFVHNVVQRAVGDRQSGVVHCVGDHDLQLLIVIVGGDSGGVGKVIKPSLGIVELAVEAVLAVDGDNIIVDLSIPVVHCKIEAGINLRTEDQGSTVVSHLVQVVVHRHCGYIGGQSDVGIEIINVRICQCIGVVVKVGLRSTTVAEHLIYHLLYCNIVISV